MSSPRTVESAGSKDIATFTIKVDGNAISNTFEVSGLSVFKGIGRIPFARIEILDGDPSAETFAASESKEFAPGKEIEILTGYRSQEDSIFKGILIGQKIRIRKQGRCLLTLLCRNPLYKSTLTKRSNHFLEKSDSDAISEIFGEYSISVNATATDITHEALCQHHTTDWDFALSRAEANGYFLIPTDAGVDLQKPDFAQAAALQLQFGATIYELDAEFDVRDQPTETTATSWDPASQEIVESTASEPSIPAAGNMKPDEFAAVHGQSTHIHHPASISQEELDAFASARLQTQRLGAITGRVQCTGTSDPLPGTILNIAGVGERFSGDLLVSAIRHTVVEGVWTTDIQFGIPAKDGSTNDSGSFATASRSQTSGLHTGVVEALEGDPLGEFRVKVNIPTLGEKAKPIWARIKSWDAGEERGSFCYPEIGDEVIIAFLNNDPRHPVILGSLFSSSKPAPIEPTDDNHEKGFFTRSSMKLHFNDDTVTAILETPNGNIIELSEDEGHIRIEDENGNSVILNADGIEIKSAADLTLTASGDVNIEGTNITSKASGQLTAEGSAGAEFKASGNTVIKGALVQIN